MAATETQTVKALYAEAGKLMAAGQDEEALARFSKIVAANANIPEVHFQIARIFLRQDVLQKALVHISAAAKLKPDVADIWAVFADIVRTLSDPEEQGAYRTALKASPLAKADARELARRVDFVGPKAQPTGPALESARVAREERRLKEAVSLCNQALRKDPGLPGALWLRAQCYEDVHATEEARRDYQSLVAIAPKVAAHHVAHAAFLHREKALPEAVDAARAGIKKAPDDIALWHLLARALADLGRADEALAATEVAARRAPRSADALERVAQIKQTLGRFEEARVDLERAVTLAPTSGSLYRLLTTEKIDLNDPIVATMQGHFGNETLSPVDRANFGFALAKVMEDAKHYGEVFRYLDPANRFMKTVHSFDMDQRIAFIDGLIGSIRSLDWTAAPVSDSAFAPIFVTGMPRSGTTLVEQIIASHSRVTGAGELGVASQRAMEIIGQPNGTFRDAKDISDPQFETLGAQYEAFIRMLYPEVDIVTDKSIQSYAYLGYLKRAMPNAKFVVVRRDPRDNLLSIYKNLFPDGTHLYAYDVEDLAEYHRQFLRIMDVWRDVAPDWFYEIQYEDLVANPGEEVPKLIAACGLEWEEGCLDFHKSDRRVETLSVYQVRQPMYKSSTRAWERYGDDIQPLLDAIGDIDAE